MKAHLIRIGNSRGICLSSSVIAQAALTDEVEMEVQGGKIIIWPATPSRAGWSDAAERMRDSEDNHLLDPVTPTHFDEKEWEW